ncbi:exodeoxyribonuclease III [Robiginitalea sp. M366]|uniref:exodeoxyribonuclease III n=1 Tax=Robiginitalea aestuariiviva TaxID=3036903 RepID=UPI00240D6218|nr:exodeoxyribonuclease III [Robiginitalea aestuariiviva]MDG1572661.1 exodeoxyribonuclease III [Robiginitalea aestuariiviva]
MKLVSWNVNGIRAAAKKDFIASVKNMDPDILCLQETKAEPEIVQEVVSGLEGYHCHAYGAEQKGYSGTAILSKTAPQAVTPGGDQELLQTEGRIQCADFGDFHVVNAYVPNSGNGLKRLNYRQEWDAAFLKYLTALRQSKPLVLCGDLNVAHQAIDLKNDKSNYNKTAGYTQAEIDGMDRLLQSGMIDTFRSLHPDTEAYSYWSYRFNARQKNIGWRIDYFLVSKDLEGQVRKAEIYPEYQGSDHCPIGLELDI